MLLCSALLITIDNANTVCACVHLWRFDFIQQWPTRDIGPLLISECNDKTLINVGKYVSPHTSHPTSHTPHPTSHAPQHQCYTPHPTPHTPHPTPHTPHPTPHTPQHAMSHHTHKSTYQHYNNGFNNIFNL